jgi:hypothetical protein
MSARAELLTDLGRALGCDLKATPAKVEKVSEKVTPKFPAELSRNFRETSRETTGLPERCYYTGDLGPPPAPAQRSAGNSYLDREARELAARGRADIIRYCQMMHRVRGGN